MAWITNFQPSGTNVSQNTTTCSWTFPGSYRASKFLYIGTNYDYVFHGLDQYSDCWEVPLADSDTSCTIPFSLVPGTTYYWRWRGTYQGFWKWEPGDYCGSFTVPLAPAKATGATPSDNNTDVSVNQQLNWSSAARAVSYDVYFAKSSNSLALISSNQSGTTCDPGTLDINTSYKWRVDSKNVTGTTQGTLWEFTTENPQPPVKAVIGSPSDDATDIPRSQQLSWTDGTGGDAATSYDVYFGTESGNLELKTNQSHSGASTATQYWTPPGLGNEVTYYWRIDAVNSEGTTTGDEWSFTTISVTLGTPVIKNYSKKLIALADDKFWYETDSGLISLGNLEIDSDGGLDLTKPVAVVSAYQKAFIVNGSLKKIVDFSNTRLTVSSLSHIPERGGILTQANGAAMVIDYIDSTNKYIYGFVTNGTFQTGQTASVTEDGAGYDYSVTAIADTSVSPLYYDWKVYPHDDDTADEIVYGKMPDEPTILALYRGKIVMAGDKNGPHIIYMSELANPFNFSYGDDSAIGASAFTGGYMGQIGDVVTAVVPYRDDYMVIGCSQSMWLMRGDPTVGGQLDQISFTAGLFDKTSYTWDSGGNLYFLDGSGIYRIPAGFGAIENLSQSTIPDYINEFTLTPNIHKVTLSYDRKKHGIVIAKTDMDTGANGNFWLDLRTEGFFPEEYPADCSVYAMHYYTSDDPTNRKLLLGCRDGSIRVFDSSLFKDQTVDSYEPISSHVVIGPGQTAKDSFKAILTQLSFVLAEDSNSIDFELYAADTAEKVILAAEDAAIAPNASGTVNSGRSSTLRPRARGAYFALKISNDQPDKTWALEKITGKLKSAGSIR